MSRLCRPVGGSQAGDLCCGVTVLPCGCAPSTEPVCTHPLENLCTLYPKECDCTPAVSPGSCPLAVLLTGHPCPVSVAVSWWLLQEPESWDCRCTLVTAHSLHLNQDRETVPCPSTSGHAHVPGVPVPQQNYCILTEYLTEYLHPGPMPKV